MRLWFRGELVPLLAELLNILGAERQGRRFAQEQARVARHQTEVARFQAEVAREQARQAQQQAAIA